MLKLWQQTHRVYKTDEDRNQYMPWTEHRQGTEKTPDFMKYMC